MTLPQLSGDLSGGYEITVENYPSLPIIESLGLKCASTVRHHDRADTYVLKPVMPFWQELDLEYESGENIAWRAMASKAHAWRNDRHIQKVVDASRKPPKYVTTGSAGFQVAEGPFHFPDATFRVIPLLADKNVLAGYLEAMNEAADYSDSAMFGQVPPLKFQVEPLEPKVYMIISTFGKMDSGVSNMGMWGGTTVRFCIPVRSFELHKDKTRHNASIGLVTAFLYSDSELGTTTGRELNGWPTVLSQISSPANNWAGVEGPFNAKQPLMSVSTNMPVALYTDQPYEWKKLIEIVDGNLIDSEDDARWKDVAKYWGSNIKSDLQRLHDHCHRSEDGEATNHLSDKFKGYQLLTINLLSGNQFLNEYSLKQFRDAKDPNNACYQAVINAPSQLKVKEIRELSHQTHVRIHKYPTQPIVETLGLVHKGSDAMSSEYILEAYRPFFIRADMTTLLGDCVCARAGTRDWDKTFSMRNLTPAYSDMPNNNFLDFINGKYTNIPPDTFEAEDNTPLKLADKYDRWCGFIRDNRDASGDFSQTDRLDELVKEEAGFEPHMAIHAMLSQEWEQSDNPRWLQSKQPLYQIFGVPPIMQLPTFVTPTDGVGPEADKLYPEKERVLDESDPCYWTPDVSRRKNNTLSR